MNIYLSHPVHGTKVAFLEQEAEADEANGWSRYTPGEPVEEPEQDHEHDFMNALGVVPKKRGRPRKTSE